MIGQSSKSVSMASNLLLVYALQSCSSNDSSTSKNLVSRTQKQLSDNINHLIKFTLNYKCPAALPSAIIPCVTTQTAFCTSSLSSPSMLMASSLCSSSSPQPLHAYFLQTVVGNEISHNHFNNIENTPINESKSVFE